MKSPQRSIFILDDGRWGQSDDGIIFGEEKKLDRGGIFFAFATLLVARVEKTRTPDLKDTGSDPAVVRSVVLSLANSHYFGVGKVHLVNY